MSDRLKELSLEITRLKKTNPDSKFLKALQDELKELLIRKRVNPTSFTLQYSEQKKQKRKEKKESNLIDFKEAIAKKANKDFIKAIETGELYNELRPKNKKKN